MGYMQIYVDTVESLFVTRRGHIFGVVGGFKTEVTQVLGIYYTSIDEAGSLLVLQSVHVFHGRDLGHPTLPNPFWQLAVNSRVLS